MFLSLKIDFALANSADLDKMLPYAAFHLGLHCLPKYLFTGTQNEKYLSKYSEPSLENIEVPDELASF